MKKLSFGLLFLATAVFAASPTPDQPAITNLVSITDLPFTYNLQRGAARFKDAIGRVRFNSYGVDVVVMGDSTGTYGDWFQAWPYLLRNMLQEKFNNPKITGGFGFMPAFHTNYPGGTQDAAHWFSGVCPFRSTGASWTFSFRDPVNNPGTGNVQVRPNPGDLTYKLYVTLDPTITSGTGFNSILTDGVSLRFGVSDFEYVGILYGGVSDKAYLDHSTSAGPLSTSTLVSPVTVTNAWGEHWPVQSGINAAVANTFQITPSTKNQDGSSAAQEWINGFIFYNGDYNEGVRLHNLSNEGSDSNTLYGTGNAQNIQANIDQFSTGANGGSRNAKLFLLNTMLNDNGYTVDDISPSQYYTNMNGLVQLIAAEPSRPCVGLIVNQPSNTDDATHLAKYSNYRDVCYRLAAENPDTVFVIDLW